MVTSFLSRRLFLVMLAFSAFVATPVSSALAESKLKVMSYNLRFASLTPPNAWPDRRPLMKKLLKAESPDIIGTQEGVYWQLKDIASDLPDYEWVGLGRNGGSKGEFMAVFYRKSRLEPLEYDHFWLSDTPDVMGSMTWGPTLPRMVTWVKFRDRKTQQEFYFFNTHFDHKVQEAREKSSRLLRDRVAALDPALPVLLTGDFNADAPANKAYKALVADGFFADTWDTATKRRPEGFTGSFNGFKALQPKGHRIDWILTRGDVSAQSIEILTFSKDGQFPSDHNPIIAHLTVGK